jgi:O-antigen/teichoic acid export membrane protein
MGLIATIMLARAIDSDEVLQYFTWWAYVLAALAYTGLVFKNELTRRGPSVFSDENENTTFRIVVVHVCYLAILICLIRIASFVISYLPAWATGTFNIGRRSRMPASLADLCLLIGISVIALSEHRRLYGDSGE